MICQTMQLVNVNYQNKSTWPAETHAWSKQGYLIDEDKNT